MSLSVRLGQKYSINQRLDTHTYTNCLDSIIETYLDAQIWAREEIFFIYLSLRID